MLRVLHFLVQLMKNIMMSGMDDDIDIEVCRKIIMTNIISIIGILALIPLGIYAYYQEQQYIGIADHTTTIILIANLVYLRKTGRYTWAAHVGIFFTGVLFLYLLISGGVSNTGHLWYYTFPLFSTFLLGLQRGTIATLILLLAAVLFFCFDMALPESASYNAGFKIRFIVSLLVVFTFAYLFENIRERTQRNLTDKNVELNQRVIQIEKTQHALRESEEKYRNLVERANDGIILVQDALITYVNPRLAEITGYSVEEMQGSSLVKYLDESEIHKVSERYKLRMRGESVPSKYETVLKNEKGGRVSVEFNAGRIFYQGKPGDLIFVRDISHHKEIEATLKKSKEIAEAANKAKSEFLANMSHELRTPLNHIIGFSELLVERHLGDLNEIQEEYLRDILHSSGHLLSLINDILDLSKVEAGKLELEISEVQIRHLLQHSLNMLKEKALKHHLKLSVTMDGIPDTIAADERKLKQIIYNLLSNGVKFTQDGGKISLSARHVSCSNYGEVDNVSALKSEDQQATGDCIEVSVSDTGIGLKKEDLLRIFNPFEQVDGSISRKYQGTGLGLTLTRRLVELHGGKIWAESDGIGKGSIFTFFIPL